MADFKRKYKWENIGDVCVLGLGKTGLSVCNYLLDLLDNRVNSVHVFAGDKTRFSMSSADKLIAKGATVSFDDTHVEGSFDLCIASPGISNLSEIYKSAKAASSELISEVEFAWRESSADSKWVAITGTNGKTTTTSLTAHILNNAGRHAVAVGNIGKVAIDEVACTTAKSAYKQTEIYVLEISSYQLASTVDFAPDISALINITPDHISWHGSFQEYANAKMKIFERCKVAVYDESDPESSKRCKSLGLNPNIEHIVRVKPNEEVIEAEIDGLNHRVIDCESVNLFGLHNYANCCIASAICLSLGLKESQIAPGLTSFKPLEHRLEPCGTKNEISYFNDSKATNVDAVLVALNAFAPKQAIFLLGGRDKNTDLTELVAKCYKELRGVVCYGEAGPRFYEAFQNSSEKTHDCFVKTADKMGDAIRVAQEGAAPGTCIVLSPACASFDEFSCFEQRGDVFKKLVSV